MNTDPFFNDVPFKVAGELINKIKQLPEFSTGGIDFAKQILAELNKVMVTESKALSELLCFMINREPLPEEEFEVIAEKDDKTSLLQALNKLEHLGLVTKFVSNGTKISYAVSYLSLQIFSLASLQSIDNS